MNQREKITGNMAVKDIVIMMCEGNPGALDVILRIVNSADLGVMVLLSLDDMNIRGPQIWVGYKDHCGEDIEKFIEKVQARDVEMVATINREMSHDGEYPWRAVKSGASFGKPPTWKTESKHGW